MSKLKWLHKSIHYLHSHLVSVKHNNNRAWWTIGICTWTSPYYIMAMCSVCLSNPQNYPAVNTQVRSRGMTPEIWRYLMLEADAGDVMVFNVFLFKKTFMENSIKKFQKHFWSHRNELIGLDFITKVAGYRAEYCVPITYRAYYVRQCLYRHGCCDRREVVNCNKLDKVISVIVTAILRLQH